MHMSLHIRDCVRDFGPVYAFWCFSFERYNGMMGQYQTNNHSISVQLMRKFITDKAAISNLPEELSQGRIKKDCCDVSQLQKLWSLRYDKVISGSAIEFDCECPLSVSRLGTLTVEEETSIQQMFRKIYDDERLWVGSFVKVFSRIRVGNEVVSSQKNPYSLVLARYPQFRSPAVVLRPGVISRLLEVTIIKGDETKISHFIAKMNWFKVNENRYFFGKNANLDM